MTPTLPLALAILGLLVGPALYAIPHWRAWDRILDSFTVAAVGGLCLFHLLPEALDHGGVLALVMAAVGLVTPRLLQSLEGAGPWMLLAGLVVHAAFESAAMGSGVAALGLAVVLHRVPVGLAVFSMYHEHPRTSGLGWVAIIALVIATATGFFVGPELLRMISPSAQSGLEAMVAGMLLHVIWEHGEGRAHDHDEAHAHDHGHEVPALAHHDGHDQEHAHDGHDHDAHRHQDHDHDQGHAPAGHGHHHERPAASGWAVAAAAVLGIAVVVTVTDQGHHHGGQNVLDTALELTLESAPALVVAYLLAGVIHAVITPQTAAWMSRGGRVGQAFKGVAFGLPLPICSCGVLPMYEALVKRGVPATAAIGFLIATPELGIDALLISLPLLGAELTVIRAAGALAVALLVAWSVGALVPTPTTTAAAADASPAPLGERLREGLRFGLVDLVDHTLPWIVTGLLVAAFAHPLLAHPALSGLSSWIQVPLFALIGVPLYVCASGATPIAAVAIYQGISPGAALAFLLAGPATNVTTFGVLTQLHGRNTALAFGAAVTVAAVTLGWGVDLLTISVPAGLSGHAHAASPLQMGALALLALLGLGSLVRQGPRGMVAQIVNPIHAH